MNIMWPHCHTSGMFLHVFPTGNTRQLPFQSSEMMLPCCEERATSQVIQVIAVFFGNQVILINMFCFIDAGAGAQ